jgi:hypothetical protein
MEVTAGLIPALGTRQAFSVMASAWVGLDRVSHDDLPRNRSKLLNGTVSALFAAFCGHCLSYQALQIPRIVGPSDKPVSGDRLTRLFLLLRRLRDG